MEHGAWGWPLAPCSMPFLFRRHLSCYTTILQYFTNIAPLFLSLDHLKREASHQVHFLQSLDSKV